MHHTGIFFARHLGSIEWLVKSSAKQTVGSCYPSSILFLALFKYLGSISMPITLDTPWSRIGRNAARVRAVGLTRARKFHLAHRAGTASQPAFRSDLTEMQAHPNLRQASSQYSLAMSMPMK
jgi:hypothetical protein